jgi:hypothetical protein
MRFNMYLAVLALAGSIVPPTLSAPIDDRYCLFSLTAGPLLISGIPLGSLVGPQDPKDSKCPKTKVFPHTTCSRSRMHQNQDSRWTATTAHTCQCQPKGPLQTTTSISTFPLSIPNTTNTQINLHPQRHLQHPQMHLKHSQMHPQHPSMHLKHSQMHPQHPQVHSRTPQDHTEANKETHPPAAQAVLAVRHSAGATRVRSRLSSNGPMPDASGDTQRWRAAWSRLHVSIGQPIRIAAVVEEFCESILGVETVDVHWPPPLMQLRRSTKSSPRRPRIPSLLSQALP